jgi:hypothetical protein
MPNMTRATLTITETNGTQFCRFFWGVLFWVFWVRTRRCDPRVASRPPLERALRTFFLSFRPECDP